MNKQTDKNAFEVATKQREKTLEIARECGVKSIFTTNWKQDGYSYNGSPMFTEEFITEHIFHSNDELERFANRMKQEALLEESRIYGRWPGKESMWSGTEISERLTRKAEQLGKGE